MSYVFPKKATQLAHTFFSEPRKGKLTRDKLPKVLQEALSETIQHNKDSIQTYIWKGNKNIILLVHGWESNSSRWEILLPYLQKSGSTIVAIDAPAHGLSSGKEFSIPRYAEFIHIAVTKFQPQYLIGHSIGGKACLYYQYKYQNEGIKKMVILGSPSDFRILLDNYFHLLSLNLTIAKGLEAKYIKLFELEIERFSGQIFASKLHVKGFIAHDVDDTVVSIEEGKKIAQSWKNSNFIQTKGLGHSMHDDDLYKNIVRFLFEVQ